MLFDVDWAATRFLRSALVSSELTCGVPGPPSTCLIVHGRRSNRGHCCSRRFQSLSSRLLRPAWLSRHSKYWGSPLVSDHSFCPCQLPKNTHLTLRWFVLQYQCQTLLCNDLCAPSRCFVNHTSNWAIKLLLSYLENKNATKRHLFIKDTHNVMINQSWRNSCTIIGDIHEYNYITTRLKETLNAYSSDTHIARH